MRPQDILILLKKITKSGREMLNTQIAQSLYISASEVSEALERCRIARLVDPQKKRVNLLALEEFLVHGMKYAFPAETEGLTRGVPTAVSASPFKEKIVSDSMIFVWPSPSGTVRGAGIKPIYRTVPQAVASDVMLHALLAIVDVFRIGRSREVEIAKKELKNIFDTYNAN